MNKAGLQNLIYHKAKISPSATTETDIVDTVIAEVLLVFCKERPWTFLKKKSTSITLSAGDYQKELPDDFLHLVSVEVVDSDNVVYPSYSTKPKSFGEDNPDLDDTGRPKKHWHYRDSNRKSHLEMRPKSDGSYTLHIWYLEKLNVDDINVIPNALVLFWGCMAVLGSPDEMRMYKNLYNEGIFEMWASDNPDLENQPEQEMDPQTETFNEYMATIQG